MQAESITALFDEWAARWARGERPDPREYVTRAGDERDQLLRMMDAYLRAAPRRAPDPEIVEIAQAWLRGESPLAELRSRQGLKRSAVVDSLVSELELDPTKRSFVDDRYHDLESGTIEPSRLSRQLAAALARILSTSEDVIRTWRPRAFELAPAYRTQAAADAASAAPYEPARDAEVDALFLSGD